MSPHTCMYGRTGLLEGGVDVQRAIVAEALARGNVRLAEAACAQARKWLTRHFTRFWVAAVSEVRGKQLWHAMRYDGLIGHCRLISGSQRWAQCA